jgi:PAS domain S-box-containing protein
MKICAPSFYRRKIGRFAILALLWPVCVAFSAETETAIRLGGVLGSDLWFWVAVAISILFGVLWFRRYRRRSDQQLCASEAWLRLSAEVAGVAVWEYDVEKDRMSRSANYDGLCGLEPQGDWTLDDFLSVMYPEDREPSRRTIEKSLAPGGSDDDTFDFRIIKPDQSICWLSVTGEVVERNAQGVAVRLCGCLMDITERRRAEDAVKESERRLRTLLGNLPGLVYRCPNLASWPFDFVSEGCFALTGYLATELLGQQIAYGDLIHPDDRQAVWRTVQDAVEADEAFVIEYRIRDKKGRERWVRERGRAVAEDGEGIAVLEGFVMDITENKRTEEALREGESQARLMADLVMGSNQPVAVGFADGRLGRINPAFCTLTGYTEKELRSIDWSNDLTPPEWLPAEGEALAELERTRMPIRYEKEYIRKDGVRIPVELFVHLARDSRGNPDYYYAFITDISERKRQQDRLQMVNDALENSLNAFEIIDAEGRFTYVNRSYVELWGYDRASEIIGTSPAEHYLDPEQPAKIISALQRSGVFEGEVIAKRKDGRTFEVLMIARRAYDANGNVIYPSSSIDITKRKQAERDLRKETSMLQLALEVSRTGAWYLNLDEDTSHRTPGHDQIFGYPEPLGDWSYERFLEHVLPEDRAFVDRKFRRSVKTKEDWGFECRIRRADGEIRWIWAVGRQDIVKDNQSHIMGGVVQDITERKQAEEVAQHAHAMLEKRVAERTAELKIRRDEAEELNRAMINVLEDLKETNQGLEDAERALRITNRELESFSYSVSHDLRAPLRHIDGFVQLLLNRENERLDETSARYLQTIAGSSRRMGHLIDDLLAFSRTGRSEMHLQPVDSNEVVWDVISELAPLTAGRQIQWVVSELPGIKADRGLLRLVWQNLIGNSVKYTGTREEARIEIGATRAECDPNAGEITFFIRDNGVGFDSVYAHKLFGVFQRLHRDDEFEGTGIGLATVRRIVHRHGGRVWAEGEVNQGASFYFTLNASEGMK